MAYYRYEVPGGEFVIRGDHFWQITFNGVQIGGLYRHPHEALEAVLRRREATVAGPNLDGVPNPPMDLAGWLAPERPSLKRHLGEAPQLAAMQEL